MGHRIKAVANAQCDIDALLDEQEGSATTRVARLCCKLDISVMPALAARPTRQVG